MTYQPIPRKLEDDASANADAGVPVLAVQKATPANTASSDGDYEFLQISAGRLWVDASGKSLTAVGDVAHDGVDSGNPVKVGGKAIAHGANPTAVAAGDRTDLYANRHGIPFYIGGHPNILTLEYEFGTSAATDFKLLDVSTGTKIVVVQADFMVSKACTVNVGVRIGFGASSGATTLSSIGTSAGSPTGAQMVLTHPKLAPGSGVTRGSGSGIVAIGGDGCDLFLSCDASTGGKARCLISYFTVES